MELVAPDAIAARVRALRPLALAVLAPPERLADLGAPNLVLCIAAASTPQEYAHALYDQLRRLDASAARRLLVALPPGEEAWEAVLDRLRRAAAGSEGQIIDAD